MTQPGRVAEDIAMLDSLLGEDRQILAGVSRRLGLREYAGIGIDQAEARGRFDERIEIIRELLTSGECTFQGEHFDVDQFQGDANHARVGVDGGRCRIRDQYLPRPTLPRQRLVHYSY